ncbi:MAG TPA: FtsQ-type POTRA domain-containing protein [Actinomycetota bacterium]
MPTSKGSWALSATGLIIVGLLAWWVTHSAVFDARRIAVTGNRQLSVARILRIGGVSERTNVMWFSPGRVERRLTADPWILAAHVSRTLPATISISVTERVPVAVLEEGRSYFIAGDGTVLGPARGRLRLPTIGIAGPTILAGSRPAAALGPLKAIAALPAGFVGQVRKAYVAHGLLTVELRSGVRAIYGDAGQAEAKGEALAAVLRWATRSGISLDYVDVRSPVSPAAGPAGSPAVLDPAGVNGPIALEPNGRPKLAGR